MYGKSSLDVVQQPEVLPSLLNGNNICNKPNNISFVSIAGFLWVLDGGERGKHLCLVTIFFVSVVLQQYFIIPS